MSGIFDTLAFVKRLTAVGMPKAQAEALADEQRRLIDDRLATRGDRHLFKNDLERVKTEINAQTRMALAAAGTDILRWMFGTMGFQALVILGAVLALSRFGR